jgi:hypothetical protein
MKEKTNNYRIHEFLGRLAVARRNAMVLVAFLYLQEVFWLIASRLRIGFFDPIYIVYYWDWLLFGLFVFSACVFAIFGLLAGKIAYPLPRVKLPRWIILGIISFAIILNFYSFFTLESNARYVSGGLTGVAGVIYGVKNAMSMAAFIILIRAKESGWFPIAWICALIISNIINIDGLASALTLGVFVFLYLDVNLHNFRRIIFALMLGSVLLYFGFSTKFSQIPDYLTPEFMLNWVIARFSIQAEQMYTYIAGGSLINNQASYIDILFRMISNRFDLVFGGNLVLEYPRSVSEATFYDMMGYYDAGSSPGALMGTALHGPLFFVVPLVFSFIFLQFFYGIRRKISFIQICAYSYLFKIVHSNFSEYLVIISPTLLTVILFIVASLVELKCAKGVQLRSASGAIGFAGSGSGSMS